ncbi:MAG: hypothetical protein HY243_06810 [Proteobacteria bacterium]|nr:hypothetical protein [Pseudomonadota bacterium]
MSSILPSLDSSILLNYLSTKSSLAANTQTAARTARKSATANDAPPWEDFSKKKQQAQDAQILTTTSFVDLSSVPKHASTSDEKKEQDNQKLFALYKAVNTLSNLAAMSRRDGVTAGQKAGFNSRFQSGMDELQSFLSNQTFNNFTLQAAKPSSSVTAGISLPLLQTDYTGATIATGDAVSASLANVSASDKFTIAVTKGGTTNNVEIDLSQVSGALTADNIVSTINQQLSAQGYNTRFHRVLTGGSIDDAKTARYGITIQTAAGEKISLSSSAATPSLYVAGSNGSPNASQATDKSKQIAADQQGRLVKLDALTSDPKGVFSATFTPTTGNTTADATVVDAQGNVYVLGTSTGDFGNLLNQAQKDVTLAKYDSAGHLVWQQMLGSSNSASGFGLALDPTGGVVVTGSTTSKLSTAAVNEGKDDSFVAKYDAEGNQSWVKQIATLARNEALAVSVDASGNVTIGGDVTGVIGSGQSNSGDADAYLAKFDSKGKLLAEKQLGTAGADKVAATAYDENGNLFVASVQNGHAVIAKYAGGDITAMPAWQSDLGDLGANGALSGLVVKNGQVTLSGSTRNASLDAGGTASIVNASSGNMDAFVFRLADNGSSSAANYVSYIGSAGTDTAGSVAVANDGTVYLSGTTTGTLAGQTRTVAGTNNLFVSALANDGSISWTRQYGGASGQSTGKAVALDVQGSSVLDALGLPRGDIGVQQSVDLTNQTTLREGDGFSVKLAGTGGRTVRITISKGETLQSLATKINTALLFKGKATVTYGHGGKTLKLEVNEGVTATLIPGADGFDALARLGIAAGTLIKPAAAKDAKSSADTSATDSGTHVFGLGLSSKLDISSAGGASSARAQLIGVLTAVRDAYRTANTAPATEAKGNTSGTAPSYLSSQLANYSLALQTGLLGDSSTLGSA